MKTKCGFSSDAAVFRRLLAAGCPMPLQIDDKTPADLTLALSKLELAVAYDRRASSEYVFPLRITNHSYARLQVCGFRAGMQWNRRLFLLAEPQRPSPEVDGYRLQSGRTFPRGEVLNHRIGECGGLAPGESMEGVLLGFQIFGRIPFDYLHGTFAPTTISVFDQFGRSYRSEIEVRIDRSATMRPLLRRPRGAGLFAETDASPMNFSFHQAGLRNSSTYIKSVSENSERSNNG
jgi:hypothetical protein